MKKNILNITILLALFLFIISCYSTTEPEYDDYIESSDNRTELEKSYDTQVSTIEAEIGYSSSSWYVYTHSDHQTVFTGSSPIVNAHLLYVNGSTSTGEVSKMYCVHISYTSSGGFTRYYNLMSSINVMSANKYSELEVYSGTSPSDEIYLRKYGNWDYKIHDYSGYTSCGKFIQIDGADWVFIKFNSYSNFEYYYGKSYTSGVSAPLDIYYLIFNYGSPSVAYKYK